MILLDMSHYFCYVYMIVHTHNFLHSNLLWRTTWFLRLILVMLTENHYMVNSQGGSAYKWDHL